MLKNVFEKIMATRSWGNSETVSGNGSAKKATEKVRKCLGDWIKKYRIKSFVDIPCGDGNWQGLISGIDDVEYKGFDISQSAVAGARQKNTAHAGMKFGELDLTSSVPPTGDMIMLRDFVQHLPLELGMQAIRNAKKAGIKYVAISTYPGQKNRNVQAGGMFFDNVQSSPYNFGNFLEDCQNYDPTTPGNSEWEKSTAKLRLFDLQAWNPSYQRGWMV